MWLFLAFLLVPLIEIALFIQVGGWIGLWWTLAIVVLTAILGTVLVRSEGLKVLGQVQETFEQLKDPTEPLAHGAMILFSGALLLTPGFFTDAVGVSLLIPSVRAAAFRFIAARVKVHRVQYGHAHRPDRPDGSTIETDYHEVEIKPRKPGEPPSGWTRD